MDDDDLDGMASQPAAEEDFSLPRATLTKLINEVLPEDITCSKKAIDLLSDCCVEFIHLISSESNEICEKEAKKMIAGEHVVAALNALGFEEFVDDINEAQVELTKQMKDREKRTFKFENTGLTEEELIKSQEQLFAAARARLNQGMQSSASLMPLNDSITEIRLPSFPSVNFAMSEESNHIPSKHEANAETLNDNTHREIVKEETTLTAKSSPKLALNPLSSRSLVPNMVPRKSMSILDLIDIEEEKHAEPQP